LASESALSTKGPTEEEPPTESGAKDQSQQPTSDQSKPFDSDLNQHNGNMFGNFPNPTMMQQMQPGWMGFNAMG
jgi:hypothetical protein